MPNDNKTKTYVLDGKTYTVPADTSMEELDQFIRGQSGAGRPIQDTSTLSASKPRSLLGRAEDWWTNKTAYEGTLDKPGRSPQEKFRAAGQAAMVGSLPLIGGGLAMAPGATLLGLGGGLAGGYAGSKAGSYLPDAPELGSDIFGTVGSIGGGMAGAAGSRVLGNKAAALLRNPATAAQSQAGKPGSVKDILPANLQRWTVPPWMIPKGEPGTPTNPGEFSKVPSRLPPNLRGDPFSPSEVPASTPSSGVNVYPEPREPMPGDRPGAAWSQGRESTLPASAQRGAPGAVDVLRNIGKPIVLTPRSGVGYPSPGEFEAMREPLLGRSTPYQGAPQLRPEVQQMAIPSAASRVPEWRAGQVDAEMSRLQSILRNPQATMEEKSIAQSQLQNYQSRPRF